jgi:hypothetical protein
MKINLKIKEDCLREQIDKILASLNLVKRRKLYLEKLLIIAPVTFV